MKPIKALLVLVTLITAPIAPALANSRIEIGQPAYGGNGCPSGSASVSLSPNGKELSILFDKFIALGNSSADSRKSCNVVIPVRVPNGFQVSLYDTDYRGYVAPDTQGTLRAEYFFAGARGPVFQRTFNGEINYNVHDSLSASNSWSKCGDSVNMRVNASMSARGRGQATVDSADLSHRGLVYHLRYRPC
jgi:Domain of unknown function (DUF4360)